MGLFFKNNIIKDFEEEFNNQSDLFSRINFPNIKEDFLLDGF
jgi:hypothetical protein